MNCDRICTFYPCGAYVYVPVCRGLYHLSNLSAVLLPKNAWKSTKTLTKCTIVILKYRKKDSHYTYVVSLLLSIKIILPQLVRKIFDCYCPMKRYTVFVMIHGSNINLALSRLQPGIISIKQESNRPTRNKYIDGTNRHNKNAHTMRFLFQSHKMSK